jgi:SAM-dependent methyltransferase
MDVVDLREFYAGPLGSAARRMIVRPIISRWPKLRGARLLGLGFAQPYLDVLSRETERTLAFCPARLGACRWPETGDLVKSCLVDEAELPLMDSSVDYALIIHGLELAEDFQGFLNEIFRVLTPQGRALFVVPNRRGLWARFDSTPFGHGRPFSRGQLNRMLRDAQFSPLSWSHGLFMPPIQARFMVRAGPAIERLGLSFSPAFAGVLMVEAVKQVYAIPPGKRVRRLVPQMKPVMRPVPALSTRAIALESGADFCHCSE